MVSAGWAAAESAAASKRIGVNFFIKFQSSTIGRRFWENTPAFVENANGFRDDFSGSDRASAVPGIGVGRAGVRSPSLQTGRADFPHQMWCITFLVLCGQLGYVVPSGESIDSVGFSHSPHHIIFSK
jgi:hypothetical protein